MKLSNMLTVSRFAFAPIIFYFIMIDRRDVALMLFILALLTDCFDGFIARKRKEHSSFGRIVDPIADKVLYLFVLLGVLIKDSFYAWIAVAFLGVALYVVGTVFFNKKKMKVSGLGRIMNFIVLSLLVIMVLGHVNHLILALFAIALSIAPITYIIKMVKKK